MSNAIDFRQLRKLEKLRIKEERRLKKEQQKHQADGKQPADSTNSSTNAEIGINSYSVDDPEFSLLIPPCINNCLQECVERNFDTIIEKSKIGKLPHSPNARDTDTISNVHYIQQCLSLEFSQALAAWLKSLPRASTTCTNAEEYNGKWTRLKYSQRNVALFDFRCYSRSNDENGSKEGKDAVSAEWKHSRMSAMQVPPLLQKLADELVRMNVFQPSHPPNHVLINEYQGDEGILAHTDGPVYIDRTATFSICGGDVLFQFAKRHYDEKIQRDNDDDNNHDENITINEKQNESVLQIKLHGNGSLVVFCKEAYTDHCHYINDRVENLVERAGSNCVNLHEGEEVMRGHRISLTFRHKLDDR